MIPLSRLLRGIADSVAIPVAGLQIDSRQVRRGDLFVALPGEHHDGRDYLGDVSRAGAAAAVVESGLSEVQRRAAGRLPVVEVDQLATRVGEIAAVFHGHPSDAMLTVGITGTNGKTTTSRVLAQLLRARFGSCGVIGTLGATLGDDTSAAANTTPDALSLQAQLSEWREQSVAAAVLEVSSHSLVQGRVGGMHFNTAVFTNLTHDHLDYHGDMESYGLAKSLLFETRGLEAAVINRDDAYAARLAAKLTPGVKCIEYSLQPGAPVSASMIRYHDSGLEAYIHSPWGEGLLHSPLAGDFNLSNLLAAISVACLAGMTFADALSTVPRLSGIDGRMQYVPNSAGLQLVVDYAHTPDALAKALQALRAHTTGRLHCVFGCGGDRDRGKRAVMGQVAAQFADRLVVTSDNPRGEDPAAIIEDILAGIDVAADVEIERGAAIALAVQSATAGDCVLVAGKGHETYQEIGARRLPFSDVEQILLALEVTA